MEQTGLNLEHVNFENPISRKQISNERIEDIIFRLISDGFQILESDELLFQIIKYTKCDKPDANDIFERMKDLGLGICYHLDFGYSIRRFANMRGYLSDSEMERLNKDTLEKIRETNPVVAKFMEKYGVDKTLWSDDIVNEYDDEESQ